MAARVGVSLLCAKNCFNTKTFGNYISQCRVSSIYNGFYSVPSTPKLFCTSVKSLVERKYSKKHEWVSVEGKIGTVGITKYAQESLGDVVYVQVPELGVEYSQEDECGAVESVKAASEIYCPVSGKVTEVNTNLEDNPSLVNKSCYDEGWLFRLELSHKEEYDSLLSDAEYETYIKTLE